MRIARDTARLVVTAVFCFHNGDEFFHRLERKTDDAAEVKAEHSFREFSFYAALIQIIQNIAVCLAEGQRAGENIKRFGSGGYQRFPVFLSELFAYLFLKSVKTLQFRENGVLRVFSGFLARQALKRPFFFRRYCFAYAFVGYFCLLICQISYDLHLFWRKLGAPPVYTHPQIGRAAEEHKTLRSPRSLRRAQFPGFERAVSGKRLYLLAARERKLERKDFKILTLRFGGGGGISESALALKQRLYFLSQRVTGYRAGIIAFLVALVLREFFVELNHLPDSSVTFVRSARKQIFVLFHRLLRAPLFGIIIRVAAARGGSV